MKISTNKYNVDYLELDNLESARDRSSLLLMRSALLIMYKDLVVFSV